MTATDSAPPQREPPTHEAPRSSSSERGIVIPTYVLAAVWICGVLVYAHLAPASYEASMQEDRPTEWATFVLFFVAAIVRLRDAVRARRVFDFLVALFCLFVAGEEISWGQRLIGFTPPGAFLEKNTQQEFNIHNFADVFGRPKYVLMMALAGYGLILPAVAQLRASRRLLERIGATAPNIALAPWFAAAIAILYWYPVTFTGEWVEAMAGGLFLATAPISFRAYAGLLIATPIVSLALTQVSAMRRAADPAFVECATAEVRALVTAIVEGGGTEDLLTPGEVHKRIWTALHEDYLNERPLKSLEAVRCRGDDPDDLASRRRFGIDPWGTAYWIRVASEPGTGSRRLTVYSFGPNRERDGAEGGEGDDVTATGVLPR